MNEQQRALIAIAERDEAARLVTSQQQVHSALSGAGGLQARDLTADPMPAKPPAARHLNLAVWLSQQAWKAEVPQNVAELSNLAFDAALGGMVESDAPAQALDAPVDGGREQQFEVLRQRYFESRSRVYAKTEMWVELVEHRARVTALRNETSRKMMEPGDQAKLRALDAEAASAETQLDGKIVQARLDARQSQQPAVDDGRKLRDFLDRGQDRAAFLKGYLDAKQCFLRNAGVRCDGLSGEAHRRCLEEYESGYRVGESEKQQMLFQAALTGYQDKQDKRKPAAFTSPGASGPCRMSWIEAYTDGYQGRSAPVFR